ncbi:hypothetical protein [Desulfurococcus mucosus]|uniref:Uncharacterized protein n=1 Tax=Desulfurococcus mucosus (strain ATCC 35584 / DSM 2162 / JCM 9187 / O7/1) TaxID=765177 RepID=E8R886_DESM0|nr:hypothetical protein [Desulfurococcus mucosus]ADV64712.1 hypothetical protein Desmu_0393 [Desulfurococcus mucosus DSM 2162]
MQAESHTSLRVIEKLAYSIARLITGKKPSQGSIHLAEMSCGNIMGEIKELARLIDEQRKCPFCGYTPGPRCWKHALYLHLVKKHLGELEEIASACGSGRSSVNTTVHRG